MKIKTKSLLPSVKSKPKEQLRDYPILIYGRERVGKTTLCAQFENPLFFFFEPGGKSLSLYDVTVESWNHFKQCIKELRYSSQFKTVVIDTVDKCYDLCFNWVCNDMEIDHPSDEKWGKGWKAIDAEFERTMFRLLKMDVGVVFTSHSEEKDVIDSMGLKRNMTAPTAGNQVMRFMRRNVDLFVYYYYGKTGGRYMRIKGNSDIVAGSRIKGHFQGIEVISAGNSEEQAYQNLVNAFNNKTQEKKDGERIQEKREGRSSVFRL